MLFLWQLELEPLGVMIIRQNLSELEIDETLIATSEGLGYLVYLLLSFFCVRGGLG